MTKAREGLLDLFITAASPLSIEELHASLRRRRIRVDISTVYREVEFFKEEGLLAEILIEKKRLLEWKSKAHHHHLYCRNCESIQEMEMEGELETLEKNIQKKARFKVENHALEFFGLCASCHAH